MPSNYKTPGVYVEEVSTFPPSVAPVATAIPAFVGYTERAIKNGESLHNTPTKISSFVEFSQYFGGAPSRNIIVRLDAQNQFVKSEVQNSVRQFYLYDSLRLFYNNGGGDCYIVSVGDYSSGPDIGAAAPNPNGILGGLKVLEKYDEPTMIVCPDATLLPNNDMYTYQQQALTQCATLQDRFFIGDLLKNNESMNGETFDERVTQVRDNIGINNLRYGALYTPFLKTTLPANLRFRDVLFADENTPPNNVDANSSRAILFGMTADQAIRNILLDVEAAASAAQSLGQLLDPNFNGNLLDGTTSLEGSLKKSNDAVSAYLPTYVEGVWGTVNGSKIPELYSKLVGILAAIEPIYSGLSATGATGDYKLQSDIDALKPGISAQFTALATHHQQIDTASNSAATLMAGNNDFTAAVNFLGIAAANPGAVAPNTDVLNQYYSVETTGEIYAYLGGPLAQAAQGAGSGAAALGIVAAALPGNLAGEINTALDAILPPAQGQTQNDLDNAIDGNAALKDVSKEIAKEYIDQQINAGVALANLQANLASFVNNIISEALSAATAAEAAGGNQNAVAAAITLTATPNTDKLTLAVAAASNSISSFVGLFNDVLSAAQSYESTFDDGLKGAFGNYKTLLSRAEQDIMVLPASGAIAGIYTRVDNERGVWKAPANVSLSSVSGPYVNINANEQEDLNVDVNAGKSINAIRAFTGKGVLVWGARTLAGNDNEWRYVPVRRFFNFAEESIKKATEQFVFEPNDANTWVKVRAMIENFLILQWRAGALAGAKPDQAFFVKIGLGETMTALDILEGRMIVEIGMAVVRPAEFIILRFSHKMQES
ncbi:MAG: phage tail sheath C-terminal domain-containing protein [Bacteroidota bacterium]